MKMSIQKLVIGIGFAFGFPLAAHAGAGFEITSTAFSDGQIIDSRHAAKGGPRKCDGENIQPAMNWTNAPDGTKSFAIVTMDDVGRHGQGVIHWLHYNIPGDATGIAENTVPEGSTGGKNSIGKTAYFGPCPDVGDVPHHYEFMLLALDLEPGALDAGMDWPTLKQKVDGHTLGATSIVGRYARH